MKPAAPGPSISVCYKDALMGVHNNTLPLPLVLATFNEPLSLGPDDFMSRWQQLTSPGLEAMEVINLPYSPVPTSIRAAMNSVSE
jgi:hypothetical protein